jgi:hypothetical protein
MVNLTNGDTVATIAVISHEDMRRGVEGSEASDEERMETVNGSDESGAVPATEGSLDAAG